MPILVKDATITDTPSTLYITVPLRSVSRSNTDIYATASYLKINFTPFFYEIDLWGDVDVAKCISKIGDGSVSIELPKLINANWPTPHFDAKDLDRSVVMSRRNQAEKDEHARLKTIKDASILAKQETAREMVRSQMKAESEKRGRVELLKSTEATESKEEIKNWAHSKMSAPIEIRTDSGIFDNDQKQFENPEEGLIDYPGYSGTIISPVNITAETFVDDDDIDLEAIRQQVKTLLQRKIVINAAKEQVAPRARGNIDVTFSLRDRIPTKTARETEDGINQLIKAKWRLRIQLTERLSKSSGKMSDPTQIILFEKASSFFKCGNYESALNVYTEILDVGNGDRPLKVLSNRAATYLKMGNSSLCISDCNECIRLIEQEILILKTEMSGQDDGNTELRKTLMIKLLARRGAAYELEGDLRKCLDDYENAILLDPKNESLNEDVARIRVNSKLVKNKN